MTLTLLRTPPAQIVAGDSIEFLVPIPSDLVGYSGSARLVCQSSTTTGTMNATSCVTEGSDFHVKFEGQSVGGTKALTPGQYMLTVWATSGNDRYTVLNVPLSITADLSTGTPALLHAQKTLAAIESAIYARLSGNTDGGIEEYSVDGVQVRKASVLELERLRSKYTAEVMRLQNPNSPLGTVKMAFAPSGSAPDARYRYGQ